MRTCLASIVTPPSLPQFLKKSEVKDFQKREAAKRHVQGEGLNTAPNLVSATSSDTSKTALRNHYVVPDHWDLTPEIRQPLDHYVMDPNVAQAIYNSMQLENANAYRTFATQYPSDAAYFFSGPPYSDLAVADFGYQNPVKFLLAGEEDLSDNDSKSKSNSTNKTETLDDYMVHKMDDYFGNVSE